MNEFYIEGKIIKIDETQEINEKFKKREFVIATNSMYPEEIKFDVINNNVNYLDEFNLDDEVKVTFIIKGNKYNDKHYINLRAVAVGELINNPDDNTNKYTPKRKTIITQVEETDDDLPF